MADPNPQKSQSDPIDLASAHATMSAKHDEPRWQQAWHDSRLHEPKDDQAHTDNVYILEMFPYPSGDLHMGHVRNYTLGDVFARFARLQEKNVLHPMGWDAFGLPAENQAIKEGVAPQTRTPQNIARMRQQMRRLGLSYAWSRELATSLPDYYRFNQWLFIKLKEIGLVYRRQAEVNWCSGCNTTIANEQVQADNSCWRGHPNVTSKVIGEWAFRITDFAQELLDGLDILTRWPDRVTQQQRHWLGKSTGCNVQFKVRDTKFTIEVFTTRVDTLFGCTYLVIAPEHPKAKNLLTDAFRASAEAFIASTQGLERAERLSPSFEKQGVFSGSYAIHPLTQEQLPIWLGNFVIADYGTGAVMAVPGHDARDFSFAKKYSLPIKTVVVGGNGADATPMQAMTQDGTLINSPSFDGLSSADGRRAIAEALMVRGQGHASVSWHLRDWGFSRQRYWGTPIPIIYCDEHGAQNVPLEDLPVRLPDFDAVNLTGMGGAPLAQLESFVNTDCPVCHRPAKREVDTMDTFVDSAWYFARFVSPKADHAPCDDAQAQAWLPIDVYVGGPEHAVMHLLYFRFFSRAMRKIGLNVPIEPAKRLLTQGMVNALAYRCRHHGYLRADAVNTDGTCSQCSQKVAIGIEKMSKSKYNGVDPMQLIETYGADVARLYVLFAAPPEKDLEWSDEGVDGLARFASRVWRLAQARGPDVKDAHELGPLHAAPPAELRLRRHVARTLSKVFDEYSGRNHFNTAIASLMELTNILYGVEALQSWPEGHKNFVSRAALKHALLRLAQMLSPMAPHIAESVWEAAGGQGLVAASRWPKAEAQALVEDSFELAVQINGKLRATMRAKTNTPDDDLVAMALELEGVARHIDNKTIVKRIVVPNRLVNLVVRS